MAAFVVGTRAMSTTPICMLSISARGLPIVLLGKTLTLMLPPVLSPISFGEYRRALRQRMVFIVGMAEFQFHFRGGGLGRSR